MVISAEVFHDLTMLYLKEKGVSALSPSELLDEYKKVYSEIKKHHSDGQDKNWFV